MIPLIVSLMTAMLFLTLAGVIYGADALVTQAWIPMVVFGLLGSGVTVFLLGERAQP